MAQPIDSWESYYLQYRPYLLSFTFRMVGSLAEAEEIVQDAFLECGKLPAHEVINHKAWLTKICSNKAINHLKSAYKRREVYPGVWLPDEIPSTVVDLNRTAEDPSPENQVELAESMTTAFLLLIEKLTPPQRAVYLLCDVFDYSFKEISELMGKDAAACRKIAQRAREAIRANRIKFDEPPENAEELLMAFYEHAKLGDRDSIKLMLSPDSELLADGGGKVAAAGRITELGKIVAYLGSFGSFEPFRSMNHKIEYTTVNSRPGVVISKQEPTGLWALDTICAFEFRGGKIAGIYAQRNPDRLSQLLPPVT